jgi:hypothetical protein
VSSDCDVLVLSGALSWLVGQVGWQDTYHHDAVALRQPILRAMVMMSLVFDVPFFADEYL